MRRVRRRAAMRKRRRKLRRLRPMERLMRWRS